MYRMDIAQYMTAGSEFMRNRESINDFVVSKELETMSSGTKVVKAYAKNEFSINVDSHISECVTWYDFVILSMALIPAC